MPYNLEAISCIFALESAADRKHRAKSETSIYLMFFFTLDCSTTVFFSWFRFSYVIYFTLYAPTPTSF